jgi:hypothetical protein
VFEPPTDVLLGTDVDREISVRRPSRLNADHRRSALDSILDPQIP